MGRAAQVVFLTSEMYPFSKTGGLGDVMGALPLAVHRQGVPCAVVTPLYGRLKTSAFPLRLVGSSIPVGYPWSPVTCEVFQTDYFGVPVYFIQREEYFDRQGYYNTYKGDYFDNCERFNFFCRAALQWLRRLDSPPAVLHANDWQTAPACAYLHFRRAYDPWWSHTKSVVTIHNLAFQGRFSSRLFWDSGLPAEAWHLDGAEHYGDFNMLKTGLAYADCITTVSPTYAQEILYDEFGCGLQGILGRRREVLSGILNGADYEVWDPDGDRYLPCAYDASDFSGKRVCKRALFREMGLADMLDDAPVLGFIGRLREQKGIDLLIETLPDILETGACVVVLGEGDLGYEARLLELMEEYHGALAVQVGYTEDLAHRIQAGCDIFLMPSRYEPCGLTQMYALRYGTPPVATSVGGLKDTIVPWPQAECTGFTFAAPAPELFLEAVKSAVHVHRDKPFWRGMVRRAMASDFSWQTSARSYVRLYDGMAAIPAFSRDRN